MEGSIVRGGCGEPAEPTCRHLKNGSCSPHDCDRESPFSRRRLNMPSQDRRSAGRRRAWGRGPIILKFDSLEKRELLSAGQRLPDLVASSFVTASNADWNTPITTSGLITNQGNAP